MIADQLAELDARVSAFERAVAALTDEAFLAPLGKWTPRDIVAHLIGWNRHVIRGSEQILKGELPFYDIDPGEDFANVNAELIRTYASRDREALLAELSRSKEELASFLRELDETACAHDHGVRHDDETITVKSTIDDLIADYTHHEQQLLTLSPQ